MRSGLAAVAAAITALVIVADYHPCDGIGRLLVLPFVTAGIAIAARVPRIDAKGLMAPGLVAATVLAVAIAVDYTSSGFVSPAGAQCEPVEGAAGFLFAAFLSGTVAMFGVLAAAFVAWVVHGALRWQASR